MLSASNQLASNLNHALSGRPVPATADRLGRGRYSRCRILAIIAFGSLAPCSVIAGGDSRVVVVNGQPGGQQVPVAPNERLVTVAGANFGGGPTVIVGLKTMPAKPDFNIITPDGVSHPFNRHEVSGNGITVDYEVQVLNNPGGDRYRVVGHIKRNGLEIGQSRVDYPAGSVYVPDPPQPPGTFFFMPDAVPLSPADEALALMLAGIPNLPGPQAWSVPSGNLWFTHPGVEPSLVHIEGGAAKGDMNCSGQVTVSDIAGFVLALTNPAQYDASFPNCDLLAADANYDNTVTVSDIGGMVALLTGQ